MIFKIIIISSLLICQKSFLYSQIGTLNDLYKGDISFHEKKYSETIQYYNNYGLNKIPLNRFVNLVYSVQKIKNQDCNEIIIKWVNQGVSPLYIKNILGKKNYGIDTFFLNSIFNLKFEDTLNLIYSSLISKELGLFLNVQKIINNDQHLRMQEIKLKKKVDIITFLESDSLNLLEIKNFFNYGIHPSTKKLCYDLLFGVIHHYNAESFFSHDDFEFFRTEMKKLVQKNLIDVFDYCYFVDKFLVFNHKFQMYGTYKEFDSYPSLPEINIINSNRMEIGYEIDFLTSSKYDIR